GNRTARAAVAMRLGRGLEWGKVRAEQLLQIWQKRPAPGHREYLACGRSVFADLDAAVGAELVHGVAVARCRPSHRLEPALIGLHAGHITAELGGCRQRQQREQGHTETRLLE